MCGDQEATEKIKDPNLEQELENPFDAPIVEVCWDCMKFVKWGKLHMISMILGGPIKPFPEWLFDTEGVWPKDPEYFSAVIRKKEVNNENTTA
jgi:hypothetical protein